MSAPPASTYVVVVSYNGIAQTVDCLRSVDRLAPPPAQVVVVDNASRDGSPAVIAAQFPKVKLIASDVNLGYAEGANVGFRYALQHGAEQVLLLNNDAVVDPGALAALQAAALAHPHAGFFGAKIYYQSDPHRIWYAGARWRGEHLLFEHLHKDSLESTDAAAGSAHKTPDSQEGLVVEATDYACGCALLVRASVLRQVGLMDPRFFLAYEEADFCFRARQQGFASLFVPAARVWHAVSASFGGGQSPLRLYYDTRNALLFGERHLPQADHRRLLAQLMAQTFPALAGVQLRIQALPALPALLWHESRRVRRAAARSAERARYLGVRDYLLRRFHRAPAELCD